MVAKFESITKTFCTSAGTYDWNDKNSINLNKGGIVSIDCKSDYSKNNLLTLMGCTINPNEGVLEINGKNINLLSFNDMVMIQLQSIGFVFHEHNLIQSINVEENISYPLKFQNLDSTLIKQKTIDVLKTVNMFEHRKRMPKQLSNFEKQQILIARALATNPKVIVCDRPTLFMDCQYGSLIMRKLRDIANQGISIVVLNLDSRYNHFTDRSVEVKNGVITEFFTE